MSDEEKKALERIDYIQDFIIENGQYNADVNDMEYFSRIKNLIEKQFKEIEELKEDRKKYAEEYIHNNPWLYKQLNENYILRVELEQRERGEYIKGTNDADELCNKKWEDKIKAKIEELEIEQESNREDLKIAIDNLLFQNIDKIGNRISINMSVREILQSLLEKE